MEKYAIIKLGGKQFMVKEGDVFSVERQSSVNLNVLFFTDGKTVLIGSPEVSDVKVKAEIVKDKDFKEKTRVARFRNKSRYRKVKGHKQPMSVIKISSITHGKEVVEAKPVVKKAVVKKTASKKTTVKKAIKATTKRKVAKKAKK